MATEVGFALPGGQNRLTPPHANCSPLWHQKPAGHSSQLRFNGLGVGDGVGDGVGGDGVGDKVGYGVGAGVGYAVGYGVGDGVGYGVGDGLDLAHRHLSAVVHEPVFVLRALYLRTLPS